MFLCEQFGHFQPWSIGALDPFHHMNIVDPNRILNFKHEFHGVGSGLWDLMSSISSLSCFDRTCSKRIILNPQRASSFEAFDLRLTRSHLFSKTSLTSASTHLDDGLQPISFNMLLLSGPNHSPKPNSFNRSPFAQCTKAGLRVQSTRFNLFIPNNNWQLRGTSSLSRLAVFSYLSLFSSIMSAYML